MKLLHRLLAAVALAGLSVSSMASVWTAADNRVHPTNSFFENFNSFGELDEAKSSGNGFAFSASADGGTYFSRGALSTSNNYVALTLDFTGGAAVHGVYGKFFATDFDGTFMRSLTHVTLLLSDNTYADFDAASLFSSGSVGFYSDDAAIEKLLFSAEDPYFGLGFYAAIDDLWVGRIPEPASWALVGAALVGLGGVRRRRNATTAAV